MRKFLSIFIPIMMAVLFIGLDGFDEAVMSLLSTKEPKILSASYALTYYANGGTGIASDFYDGSGSGRMREIGGPEEGCGDWCKTYLDGEECILLSRKGYRFKNWNTEPGGTGKTFLPGDIIYAREYPLRLFAIWEKILEGDNN